MGSHPEETVNAFYEFVFLLTKVTMVLMVLGILAMLAMVLYERYVEGNEDAFKSERRTGPADRRAEAPGR